jgi:hypothetical protein
VIAMPVVFMIMLATFKGHDWCPTQASTPAVALADFPAGHAATIAERPCRWFSWRLPQWSFEVKLNAALFVWVGVEDDLGSKQMWTAACFRSTGHCRIGRRVALRGRDSGVRDHRDAQGRGELRVSPMRAAPRFSCRSRTEA